MKLLATRAQWAPWRDYAKGSVVGGVGGSIKPGTYALPGMQLGAIQGICRGCVVGEDINGALKPGTYALQVGQLTSSGAVQLYSSLPCRVVPAEQTVVEDYG
jgi:hypothetical protein